MPLGCVQADAEARRNAVRALVAICEALGPLVLTPASALPRAAGKPAASGPGDAKSVPAPAAGGVATPASPAKTESKYAAAMAACEFDCSLAPAVA